MHIDKYLIITFTGLQETNVWYETLHLDLI